MAGKQAQAAHASHGSGADAAPEEEVEWGAWGRGQPGIKAGWASHWARTGPGGVASGNGIGDTKRAKLRLTRPLPLGTWDGTAAMPQCPMPCHATAGTKSRGLPACLPACLSRTRRTQPTSVSTTQMTLLVDDGQCLVSGSQRGWVDFGEREEGGQTRDHGSGLPFASVSGERALCSVSNGEGGDEDGWMVVGRLDGDRASALPDLPALPACVDVDTVRDAARQDEDGRVGHRVGTGRCWVCSSEGGGKGRHSSLFVSVGSRPQNRGGGPN